METATNLRPDVLKLKKEVAQLRRQMEEIEESIITDQDLADVVAAEEDLRTGRTVRVR